MQTIVWMISISWALHESGSNYIQGPCIRYRFLD